MVCLQEKRGCHDYSLWPRLGDGRAEYAQEIPAADTSYLILGKAGL
jgi:hypothetical protein